MMPSTKPEVHNVQRKYNDAGGGPSYGHSQHAQKLLKIAHVVFGDILSDRQTHRQTQTDVLITVLRNRSRGQSNERTLYCIFLIKSYF